MKNQFKFLAALLALVVGIASVQAADIYNNSTTDTGNRLTFTNGQIIGQEIIPDSTALAGSPYLTSFSFEYYSPNSSFSGSVQAEVKFYLNNGTPFNGFGSPGTAFYDSGWFSLAAPLSFGPSVATIPFGLPELYLGGPSGAVTPLDFTFAMPSDFTVVYSFQGLSGSDSIGLASFNAPGLPSVGLNNADYWVKNGGSWELDTNTAGPIAFGMVFSGSPEPAPEPTVLGLGAMGLVVMARLIQRRKQQ